MPRCRPRRWPTRRGARRSTRATRRPSASARSVRRPTRPTPSPRSRRCGPACWPPISPRPPDATSAPSSCSAAPTPRPPTGCCDSSAWRRSSASSRRASTSRRSPTATRPMRCANRPPRPPSSANGSRLSPRSAPTRRDRQRDAALSAVADAEVRSTELYAQLAALKDTTADLERAPRRGARPRGRRGGAAARAGAGTAARRRRPRPAPPPQPPPRSAGGGTPAAAPAPAPAPPPRATPRPPNSSAVETAIWFATPAARRALRARRRGPERVGLLGPHQGGVCRRRHLHRHALGDEPVLHPRRPRQGRVARRSIQRGDLLFWGSGGDYYHVAIYLGGGRILEAPREGVPVREYFIWGSPSAAARPS